MMSQMVSVVSYSNERVSGSKQCIIISAHVEYVADVMLFFTIIEMKQK